MESIYLYCSFRVLVWPARVGRRRCLQKSNLYWGCGHHHSFLQAYDPANVIKFTLLVLMKKCISHRRLCNYQFLCLLELREALLESWRGATGRQYAPALVLSAHASSKILICKGSGHLAQPPGTGARRPSHADGLTYLLELLHLLPYKM